ncbi:outer membrane receptor protein involved in Fe transport [Sphingomonas sp. SORGH_AS870]|nr:outer membrane receptor protein involved in Fe transport [Sphingomonas sp. SORGH_AS_0870]
MRYRHLLSFSVAALAITTSTVVSAQTVPVAFRPAAGAADGDPKTAAIAEEPQQADIVVQGQRQQYVAAVPTIEVPQSIQVLSAETLRDAGVTRLDNALDFATGIARQNNFGGLFDVFACRGFSGDEGSASNYLVNGFNAARGYGGSRDTSNVEQIQVLKGPNSSLFGRGEPGCTVNIITKKPGFDLHGGAILSAGSFNTFRSEGDFNVPLSSRIAMRVTGAAESADSFRDFNSSRKITVTPSFLVKLGEDSSASYEFEFIDQKVTFDRGIVARRQPAICLSFRATAFSASRAMDPSMSAPWATRPSCSMISTRTGRSSWASAIATPSSGACRPKRSWLQGASGSTPTASLFRASDATGITRLPT